MADSNTEQTNTAVSESGLSTKTGVKFERTETNSSGSTQSELTPDQVREIGNLLKTVIVVVCFAIATLAIDLFRDNQLHTRISELEKQITEYKLGLATIKEDVGCVKIRSYFQNFECK